MESTLLSGILAVWKQCNVSEVLNQMSCRQRGNKTMSAVFQACHFGCNLVLSASFLFKSLPTHPPLFPPDVTLLLASSHLMAMPFNGLPSLYPSVNLHSSMSHPTQFLSPTHFEKERPFSRHQSVISGSLSGLGFTSLTSIHSLTALLTQ